MSSFTGIVVRRVPAARLREFVPLRQARMIPLKPPSMLRSDDPHRRTTRDTQRCDQQGGPSSQRGRSSRPNFPELPLR
jgi:hypothetical protein